MRPVSGRRDGLGRRAGAGIGRRGLRAVARRRAVLDIPIRGLAVGVHGAADSGAGGADSRGCPGDGDRSRRRGEDAVRAVRRADSSSSQPAGSDRWSLPTAPSALSRRRRSRSRSLRRSWSSSSHMRCWFRTRTTSPSALPSGLTVPFNVADVPPMALTAPVIAVGAASEAPCAAAATRSAVASTTAVARTRDIAWEPMPRS